MRNLSKYSILLIIVSVLLTGCSNYKFKETIHYEVEDFEHTNHRGEKVSLSSLKGKPWLAMFIFTNCTTICNPMTYNMTEIQQKLIDEGVEDYEIVAFSVDPKNDTEQVLAKYLARYSVPDEEKWNLLTGYDQTYMEQFAAKSFHSLVKAVEGNSQVMHASTFYLVNEEGIAVKYYTGYSAEADGVPYETIAIDLKTLLEQS